MGKRGQEGGEEKIKKSAELSLISDNNIAYPHRRIFNQSEWKFFEEQNPFLSSLVEEDLNKTKKPVWTAELDENFNIKKDTIVKHLPHSIT